MVTGFDSLPAAERYVEKHARIIKLQNGRWRVCLCSGRWYGETRPLAISSAAQAIQNYDFLP